LSSNASGESLDRLARFEKHLRKARRRNGQAAPRLLAAETPDIEAASRRDAVARWRGAMAAGLSADEAAKAVGVPRATSIAGKRSPIPKAAARTGRASRATQALRRSASRRRAAASHVGQAQDRRAAPARGRCPLRFDNRADSCQARCPRRNRARSSSAPQTSKPALPLHRRAALCPAPAKGAKSQGARRARPDRYALYKHPSDEAIKHITAYDPVAKWTAAHVARYLKASGPKALLDKIIETAPFKISGIQVDGGSEFKSIFEDECQRRGLELFVLPPKRPGLNGCVERAQSTWRYEFYAVYDLPDKSKSCRPASMPSPTTSTPNDRTMPLPG
jgi:putative transposase